MAVYGLVTTTVGISVTLLGWEFYAFSTREILARAEAHRAICLRDQLAFYGVSYLLLLPAALPVFASGILPWRLAPWFYVLAISDHLGQETARILNTLFRPVLSSALFFVRSAAWGLIVIALGAWRADLTTIVVVLASWSAGEAAALALGAVTLGRLDWSGVGGTPVDWGWVRRGLLVATPFFVSAISYRVIELADRYIIHFLLTDEAVAVYSFYGTLANMLPAVIGAGVTSVLVPRIIEAHQLGRAAEYHRHYRAMNAATFAILVVSLPLVFGGIVALQRYLNRPEYARELPTAAALLLSTAVSVVAQLPGVALYARRDDMALLKAVLVGAVVNTALNIVLIPRFGIGGAAWATIIAYAAMGAYQMHRVFKPVRL
jgi:O-antigen/teichoic acid export membrane protein